MRKYCWLGLLLLLGLPCSQANADAWRKDGNVFVLKTKNLSGKLVDHTANHGTDRRIWSRSLYQRRDMYVYIPPKFSPCHRYPVMIWFHDFYQDEQEFLRYVKIIDDMIVANKLPPIIIAAPDGSFKGEPDPLHAGSFFINSKAGYYGDFVLQDVWDYLTANYPICEDRCAHVLAGVGMGGFAAYNHGIKNRNAFGTVMGIMPVVNWRWMDQKGNYHAQFTPYDWGWRMDLSRRDGRDIIAVLNQHVRTVKLKHWIEPLYGLGMEAIPPMSADNPIELLERACVRPGELNMYIGYTGKDEFNIDAQVESFVYAARFKGLEVGVGYNAHGHHQVVTAKKLLPGALKWLAPKLAPFNPIACDECVAEPMAPPTACENGACQPEHGPLLRRNRRFHGLGTQPLPTDRINHPPISLPDYLPN